jgi:hypothetical protein
MAVLRKILRVVLIVLNIFLALTAAAGGVGLLTNLNAPPVEQLGNSIFKDFTVPGLALVVIVGGGAALATVLLIRKSRFASLCSLAAGIAIMFFEFVEVLVIGSPVGIARDLQIFYFGLGTSITVLVMTVGLVEIVEGREE